MQQRTYGISMSRNPILGIRYDLWQGIGNVLEAPHIYIRRIVSILATGYFLTNAAKVITPAPCLLLILSMASSIRSFFSFFALSSI